MNESRNEPHGTVFEEAVEGGGRLRVEVVRANDGRFGYVAQFGYASCDGPFRDRVASVETFALESEACRAGVVKARQLAGIDVPEA